MMDIYLMVYDCKMVYTIIAKIKVHINSARNLLL